MTFCPVVTGTGLAKDKVIRTEKLTKWSCADTIHGAWLQIHQDGTGDVTATGCFVEVHVDTFKLQIRVAVVGAGRIDSVFIRNHFPELGTNLVAALASLDVHELTHCVCGEEGGN